MMRTKMHRKMVRKKFSKRCPPRERMIVSPTLLSGQTVQKPVGFGNSITRPRKLHDEEEDECKD